MDLTPISAVATPTGDAFAKPRNAAEAAEQFEALLIAQMLRAAHNPDASLDPEGTDSTQETLWDLAAQQFAQVLAHNGGLGLGKMISASLKPPAPRSAGPPLDQ
jgi:Rod binding domain-containing protein